MESRRLFPCTPLVPLALCLTLLPACHDSSSGSSGPVGSADILIHDAAADDLRFFSADIRSVRLRRLDGGFTSDLLRTGEVRVEFLGLEGASVLLARAPLPVQDYDAVEVGFTPDAYRARAESGLDVTVASTSDTFLAQLPSTLSVVRDAYVRLDVDLDLGAAVDAAVPPTGVSFSPEGAATSSDGVTPLRVRDTKARVTAFDEPSGRLTVESFADDAQAVPLGERSVHTDATALFLGLDGSVRSSAQFYAELVPGRTLLRLHGTLGSGGDLEATRIDIEDHAGGAGSLDAVCIEGTVTGLSANGFELRLEGIEDGAVLAEPIIAALVDQAVIDVSFDAGTVFVLGRTVLADASALEVGRRVEVRFCSFATSPFAACLVDVSGREPAFEGTITDVSGAPLAHVMRLDADAPAIVGGLVQGVTTDVRVVLGSSSIRLAGAGEPALVPADLVPGLELETRGTLSGTALLPSLAASEVRVQGGLLRRAAVSAVDEANAQLTTSAGTLVDSFGASVTPGTQLILIQPAARFTGLARTQAEFFALLGGVQGNVVEVSVRGLGSAVPNQIRAFELHTRLPAGG